MAQKIGLKTEQNGQVIVYFDYTEGGWGLCHYCKGIARAQCIVIRSIEKEGKKFDKKDPIWKSVTQQVEQALFHNRIICSKCIGKHVTDQSQNSNLIWDVSL